MTKKFPRGTAVQSVLFDKKRWTTDAARKWLSDHGYKSPPADTTKEHHRFMQSPPFKFRSGTFRTIPFGKGTGVKAVIAVPRDENAKKNPAPSKYTDKTGTLVINKNKLRDKLEKEYSPFLVAKYLDAYIKWFNDEGLGTKTKVVTSGPLLTVRATKDYSASYLRSQFAAGPFSSFLRIHTPYKDYSEPHRKNPTKKRRGKNPEGKTSRIPSMMADLATALSLELEDGTEIKFPISGNFAMCANAMGDELWIISRKGSHKVAAEDEKTEKLFEKFTGFEADDHGRLVQIPNILLKRVGRVKAIIYRSDKFSSQENDYIHAFKQYPTVSVDDKNRPKIVAIRGGRIRVTAEGITG